MRGPDQALVEYAGNRPAERFNHVHLYQEDPIGALEWYQQHLNAPLRPGYAPTPAGELGGRAVRGPDRTWPALNREGMFRSPRAGVEFGDVSMMWYANQGDRPLVSSRGQLQDHIALKVADLDAWADKLKSEGVTFLEQTLPARRHPRPDDRRPQPRSHRAGRGPMNDDYREGANPRIGADGSLTGRAIGPPAGEQWH